MKLKRILSVLCLGGVLVGLLAGCGGIDSYDPLPREMDEQTVLAAGKEVFDLLMAEEYEIIVGMFREDIRNKKGAEIKPEHIKELVNSVADPEEVGTFERIKETHTRGSSDPEKHGIAVFECDYSENEKTVAICVAFDLDMNLIGLSVLQGDER